VPEATDLAEFQFFSLAAALALLLFALLWEFSIELPERRALRQLEKDVARIGGDPSSRIETKKLPRQFQHFGNALNQLAQDFQSKLNQAMHLAAIPQPPPGDYSAMLGEEPTKPSPMAAEPPPPVTEPGGNKRAAPPAPPPGDEPSIPPAPQWEPPPTPSGPVALPGPGGPAPELPSDWASPPPPSDGGMAEPLDAPMPPPPPLDLDAPPPPDVPPGREPTVAQPYPQELIDATRSPDAIPEPPPPEPEMVDEIEAHHQEVYKNFLATRQQCGEPTEGLSYEKFKPKLLTLEAKHPGKKVRFTVYVKDGKAALKASVK
jgi:hypothetical protein